MNQSEVNEEKRKVKEISFQEYLEMEKGNVKRTHACYKIREEDKEAALEYFKER